MTGEVQHLIRRAIVSLVGAVYGGIVGALLAARVQRLDLVPATVRSRVV